MREALTDLKLIEKRAANHIYECKFEGKPAIAKFVTKAGLPRFAREVEALEAGQGLVPELYYAGSADLRPEGDSCIVMEKVHFNYEPEPVKELLLKMLWGMWSLYRKGVFVNPRLRNVGLSFGEVKWLDFNDDTPEELGYKDFRFVDYFRDGPLCFNRLLDDLHRYHAKRELDV